MLLQRLRHALRETHGDLVLFRHADVRDAGAVRDVVRRASAVFHFAAQVAVTTSLTGPLDDFEVNAGGTLHVLEAIRQSAQQPPLFFTSTNKVYGGLEDVSMREDALRYTPRRAAIERHGISEERPLDFHSPYGCSKGAADQYVRDYARSFGLRTVVFRMSCIYGPHQFGTEDQGWVAHFLIRAINREPITVYGDGRQVRDIDTCSGQAFNIGGGAANTISLRELLSMIARFEGREPRIDRGDWRPGDQKYYVSDTRGFGALTGWKPAVPVEQGIAMLRQWLRAAGVPALVQHGIERPLIPASPAAMPRTERPRVPISTGVE